MNRLPLFVIIALVANVALANKSVVPVPVPVAATAAQEAGCPASKRAHVTKVNVNSDGSYAHSSVVKVDKSGVEVVIYGPERPSIGWFLCMQ